jgi:hypothetical protein
MNHRLHLLCAVIVLSAFSVMSTTQALVAQANSGIEPQPQHIHEHDSAEKLGQVHFKISCTPAAQRRFNRAVAWLHSFEYEEAARAFSEVALTDPRCGMAYWGIAMSNYHPLWAPPTAAELQQGVGAVAKAQATGARTQRERDYIAAIAAFYQDSEKLDQRTRALAYSEAMHQLQQHHPEDNEAAVFYALALIATGTMVHDKRYLNEKQAAQILTRVLAREPQHPGVAHYLIHGYDYPALAHLALPAARSYAAIAPASAHALHMPSHIFTRLGLWQEAIRSNLAAESAARAYAVRNHLSGVWDEQLHAMDYLVYAYLQGAQDKQAREVLNELSRIQKVSSENFKVAYAVTAIPARYALERREWREAANLQLPQADGVSPSASPGRLGLQSFPWQSFPWAEAHIHFARAIGAARSGDKDAARAEVKQLTAIKSALVAVKGDYDWATQVDIERLLAAAWLAYAEGQADEALRLGRAAADVDDATDKHPVTPGAILPAREQLGELLLELKQPAAALHEFETSLRTSPNRFSGLYGAARAARLTPAHRKAKTYYAKLMALCRDADSLRPEMAEAKAYLAGAQRQSAGK